MQNLKFKYEVNPFERLFAEKSIESLYANTIDSYRLRLHNPKTLIQELISVTQASTNGVLTNNDYVNNCCKELKRLLQSDFHELTFNKINQSHYVKIIDRPDRKNYKLIIQSSKLILKENNGYWSKLLKRIVSILNSYDSFIEENGDIKEGELKRYEETRKELVVLIDFLYIELINKGFTKQYLYRTFQSIFIYNRRIPTFEKKLNVFRKIIEKENETFSVIFLIHDKTFQFEELEKIDSSYQLIDKKFRKANEEILSEEVNEFLEKNKNNSLILLKFSTKDYFKAIQLGVDKLSKDLDVYHLGYNRNHFKIDAQCATIGENDPSKSSVSPSNFQIDGYFKSDSEVFSDLLGKIKSLQTNNVDNDSYEKILSAIRYYRTGSESPELETKLLNYWIGLEFIFTSFNSEEKTIDRIRNYFPKCHSLIYVKRNFYDFHKSLERLKISGKIPDYNSDLKYLLNHSNYEKIVDHTESELLKFRSKYFQKWYEEPNKIRGVLKKHQENIEWNITRLYRLRNEIVHNAAIKSGIYTHIAHLKYYLSFILNSILDFMANGVVDIDNDGKITIDDYLITQEIILGSLINNKLENFLKIENPNEIFQ